jgi:tetratricopeptide (TPR) repeat protein
MFCRPQSDELARRGVALLVGALLVLPTIGRAADPTTARQEPSWTVTPSELWVPAFVAWVDRRLSLEQLREARDGPRPPELNDTAKVLDKLVLEWIEKLQDPLGLPPYAIPPLNARGITGATLEVARSYMEGHVEEALRRLEEPDLRAEPLAAHVRAQLLDEQTRDAHPRELLDLIDTYRAALRVGPDAGPAHRARLRIGQIYLQIGFVAEARAELGILRDVELPDDLSKRLQISLAEAAFRVRDLKQSLEELERLSLEHLPRDARRWAHHRRGDVLLALHRFPPAADEYRQAQDLHDATTPPTETLRLRLAVAQLESGKPGRALKNLKPIPHTSSAESALAGLLRSRAYRQLGEFDRAAGEALRILDAQVEVELGALAGVAAIEAERMKGRTSTAIPPGASKILEQGSRIPGVGLLAYEIAKITVPSERHGAMRRRIAEVLVTLPEGSVRALVRRDLSHRIGAHLADFLFGGASLDAGSIEDLERFLHPRHVPEDLVLLALETFFRTGEHTRCANWARALHAREVRPIRKGLAIWREAQCTGGALPDPDPASALRRLADSGEAGAFSLPLLALVAEGMFRRGEMDQAREVYERGLESFRTPDLVGPVLVRLGEVWLVTGRADDAARPVLEGLALLDPEFAPARPFRSVGLVTLLRIAEWHTPTAAVRASVRDALQTAPEEWGGPLRYLAARVKLADPPSGDGLFARAGAVLREADQFSTRLRKELPASGSSAKRGAGR